ncbi:MAG TPA: amidohydrolase [Longimicrobiales bacterium]|nr:amidohydrolase [Longimicrobiales bacterium]
MKQRTWVRVAGPLFVLAALVAPRGAAAQAADLVLRNGKIVTVDAARPEAQALAVRGDRIVAVGSDAEIAKLVGPRTRVIDLRGRLAVPGFIESHGHFMGLGQALMELDLTKARTWDDIVALVKDAAAKAQPGEWIVGRGWHQEKWDRPPQPNVEGLPYHTGLSAVSPNNPVALEHASGHAMFVNAKAMELAGIGSSTPSPAGGEIVRDAKGVAIGMLRDNAMDLVGRAMRQSEGARTPAQVEAHMRRQVELAAADALKKGITSFQDQGESFATIAFYQKLADEGKLPIRLYAMVEATPPETLAVYMPRYRMVGYGHDHLTVRAIGELSSDGALGTHSAWFLEPFTDLPTSTGLNVVKMADIRAMAEVALKNGYQVAVHAIGDRANRETLDLFEALQKEHPEAKDARWRIEHAQHLSPSDIPRFAKLGVIASMQGIHACSDGPYVVKRLGEARAKAGAYVWRSLLESGAVIANGTDVPVEDEDPIANFGCSVSRRLRDGSTFYPAQVMTRAEALRSYTRDAAFAAFEEDRKGTLTPGKLADIVVLSRDIMTIPADQIAGTRVEYTIVGGKVLWDAAATRADRGGSTGSGGARD